MGVTEYQMSPEHTLTVTTQTATYRFSYILLAIGKQWYPRMAHRARLVRMPIQWNYFHPRGKGQTSWIHFELFTKKLEGIVRGAETYYIGKTYVLKPYLTEYLTALTQEHGTNREFGAERQQEELLIDQLNFKHAHLLQVR